MFYYSYNFDLLHGLVTDMKMNKVQNLVVFILFTIIIKFLYFDNYIFIIFSKNKIVYIRKKGNLLFRAKVYLDFFVFGLLVELSLINLLIYLSCSTFRFNSCILCS
jgi:hypothetical protein